MLRMGVNPDWCMPSMLKMSRLGNVNGMSKIRTGNIHRDLMKCLGNPSIPQPCIVQVPMVLSKPGTSMAQQGNVEFPIMLPHEMLAYYYNQHNSTFYKLYMGTEGSAGDGRTALEDFWTSVETVGDPRLHHHPMKQKPDWKTTYIPMALHGDAVPVIKVGKAGTKSFDVTSISPLMAAGQTKIIKQFAFGLFEKCKVATRKGKGKNQQIIHDDNSTTWHIWRVVLWSLHFAFLGIWPTHDADGNAYDPDSEEGNKCGKQSAHGLCLVIHAPKGDLDHLAKEWGLRNYNSKCPCQWCLCGRLQVFPTMRFNYFGEDAAWKTKFLSILEWRASYSSLFYIFELEYITHLNIEPDELHIMHLGTSMYMAGSVLYMLVFQMLDGTPHTNLEQVWSEVVDYYTEHRVVTQFTHLELSMFHHDNNYPKLSGKGAEVKDLIPALHHVWKQHYNPYLRHHMFVDDMLYNQCEAQDILAHHKNEMLLPEDDAILLAHHVDNVLVKYSLLANWADKEGHVLFNVAPKHHYLWHMGQQAKYLNPRKANTMLDETFMGVCKDLAKSCAHGSDANTIHLKCVEKYRWALH